MRVLTAHLVPLDPLASVVLQAQPDPQVSPDVVAHKDPQAQLERRADRERKDLKDQPGETVFRDLWVFQGLEDLLDHPERTETRESSESPARREAKATKESTARQVPLALKDPSEHLVLPEQMVSPVPEVSRVFSDRRETKGPEDSPDLQAQSGCRACLDLLVRKVKLETLVKWVHLVLLVQEAPQDPLEPMALRDPLAVSETLVLLEKRETLARLESLVLREKLAHRVQEAREEKRESQGLLVLLDPRDLRGPLEMMAPKEALVQVDFPVTLVPLESPVLLG